MTGVWAVTINATYARVFWLAVQLPPDGILMGYTVYYRFISNTPKRQSGWYVGQTFPPTTTWGDISNLNPNEVYQFSVVVMVTILGKVYGGEITSLAYSPTNFPG